MYISSKPINMLLLLLFIFILSTADSNQISDFENPQPYYASDSYREKSVDKLSKHAQLEKDFLEDEDIDSEDKHSELRIENNTVSSP